MALLVKTSSLVPVLGSINALSQGWFRCLGPWLPGSRFPPNSQPAPTPRRSGAAIPRSLPRFLRGFEATSAGSASLIPDDPRCSSNHPLGMLRSKRCSWGSLRGRPPRANHSPEMHRTNAIETVGARRGNHTFFEMLGNFSVLATNFKA